VVGLETLDPGGLHCTWGLGRVRRRRQSTCLIWIQWQLSRFTCFSKRSAHPSAHTIHQTDQRYKYLLAQKFPPFFLSPPFVAFTVQTSDLRLHYTRTFVPHPSYIKHGIYYASLSLRRDSRSRSRHAPPRGAEPVRSQRRLRSSPCEPTPRSNRWPHQPCWPTRSPRPRPRARISICRRPLPRGRQ
jgi:hypothetical protein